MSSSKSHGLLNADNCFPDSYNMWCRHNGKHSTTTHKDVDWNAQIIWQMRMELAFQWEILQEEIPTLFKKLTENLSKELTWLKDDTILRKYLQLQTCIN